MTKLFSLVVFIVFLAFCGCEANDNLSRWADNYEFQETVESTVYKYYISIADDNNDGVPEGWIEIINVTQDTALLMASATISGTSKKIELYIDEYAPYRHGDGTIDGKSPIVTLTMKKGKLYTKWGALQPKSKGLPQEGVYFNHTTTAPTTAPVLYWRGWPYGQGCAQRDRAVDTYSKIEIDGSGLMQSTEGSAITGYYGENKQLQIMEMIIYGETGRSTIRFYPFEDAVAMKRDDVWYTTPLMEMTEEDQYHDGTARMSLENGQLYYYIDGREPMYASGNTWYAEAYAKAVQALGNASASE